MTGSASYVWMMLPGSGIDRHGLNVCLYGRGLDVWVMFGEPRYGITLGEDLAGRKVLFGKVPHQGLGRLIVDWHGSGDARLAKNDSDFLAQILP